MLLSTILFILVTVVPTWPLWGTVRNLLVCYITTFTFVRIHILLLIGLSFFNPWRRHIMFSHRKGCYRAPGTSLPWVWPCRSEKERNVQSHVIRLFNNTQGEGKICQRKMILLNTVNISYIIQECIQHADNSASRPS